MKILTAKYILPISSEPIENGALVIDQDRIRFCGPLADLKKESAAEKIDLGDCVIMPGLINAHTHLEYHLSPPYDLASFSDLSGEPNYIRWLIQLSQYQDGLKVEEKQKAIEAGLEELKSCGVTTVVDWTTYEGSLSCYEASGLRVVTFPEVMNLNQKLSQDRFESALAFVDEVLAKDSSKIRAGLAPFAPYTLSKNLLKIFTQHLKSLQIPLQIHTSTSFAEMEFFYDSKGDIANLLFPYIGWGEQLPPPHQKTPIQYLNDIEFLSAKPALVGCTHLGPTDLALIARSGSSVVYCPRANETLGLGKTPLRKMIEQKIPIALGSEQKACVADLDFWKDLKCAYELNTNESITAREILEMATLGGARSLNLQKEIGSLEKGKFADLIVLSIPENTHLGNVEQQLIEHASKRSVQMKWVAGEEIK
ncbi:MAG: amidohydrolase family protein [Deltaproteobacteria bacterium]|nr:amidohydrolase family protein [Deltaproteobacteria bacterium]